VTEFTPIAATIGGLAIGTASVLLLALNGRIAGISGIMNGVFTRDASDRSWRLMFVAGLILGGVVWALVDNQPQPVREDFPLTWLIGGGLLVGIGTRLGSGCTSGHGVCGIGRLSLRSVAATMTFLIVGVATASLLRPLLGLGL